MRLCMRLCRLCMCLCRLRMCLCWRWSMNFQKKGNGQKFSRLKSFFSPSLPHPGLYQFDFMDDLQKSRVHLRLEQDYNGTLIVNANRIFYLNSTAALIAYSYLSGDHEEDTVRLLCKHFSVPDSTAYIDYTHTKEQINALIHPESACPICDLDVEVNSPFSARPTSPYRMDLALTYRCNNDCSHCYNVSDRQDPELSTDQWKSVLDQLWTIGIPHIVFTGGEPTLRDDLPELNAHAEANGQITGVNTNGRRINPCQVAHVILPHVGHLNQQNRLRGAQTRKPAPARARRGGPLVYTCEWRALSQTSQIDGKTYISAST